VPQDEVLDRLGKAILAIGGRHQVGLGLDLVAGVARGNAEARRSSVLDRIHRPRGNRIDATGINL
jgi:hypothetical protein